MTDFTAYNSTTHPIIKLEDDYNNILDHGLEKAVTYIIRKNGANYEALNGSTGKISYGSASDAGGVDGASATAVAQAAITATTNGTVLFGNGTFTLSGVLSLKSGVDIRGQGENTILKMANGVSNHIFYGFDQYKIKISDMTLDLSASGSDITSGGSPPCGIFAACTVLGTPLYLTVERIHTIDAKEEGVIILAGNNVTIQDCYFEDSVFAGVHTDNDQYLIIQNNYITGGEFGVKVTAASFNNIIRGNIIVESTTAAIGCTGSGYNLFSENIFYNVNSGFTVSDDVMGSSDYNQIINNTINTVTSAAGSGVGVLNCQNNLIAGNIITNCDYYNIVEDGTSDNNSILGNSLLGDGNDFVPAPYKRLYYVGAHTRIADNRNYNRVGYNATPFTAASTTIKDSGDSASVVLDTVYTNSGSAKVLYITGGTVVYVKINGTGVGLTSGCFFLATGDTLEINGSVAPDVCVMVQ